MALNVYEVAPGNPAGFAGVSVRALAFSTDGGKLASGNTVWASPRHGSRRSLVPLESSATTGRQFFVSPGQLWTFGPWSRPGEPFTLAQVFPDKQEIRFNWVEHGSSPHTMPMNLAASPDGKRLLLAWQVGIPHGKGSSYTLVGQLELHDLTRRRTERIWVKADPSGPPGLQQWPLLLFSPDGHRAVAGGYNYNTACWDVEAGKVLYNVHLETQLVPGHSRIDNVTAAAFSPDGRLLYTAATAGRFDVIDVESGLIRRTWYEPQAAAHALAVSSDGRILASAGEDKLIRLWDPSSGKELARWLPHPSGATALAFHPDGQVLASGSDDGTVKLWDLPFIRKELAAIGLDW